MDITTPFLNVTQLAAVPLTMAIVSILKSVGLTGAEHRWAPLWSLGLGMAVVSLVPSSTWQFTVLAGLTVGCIAAGVYSGTKTVVAPEK